MFGHQDEPQQPQSTGFNMGQSTTDTSAGAPPVDPSVTPPTLLEPRADDGFTTPPLVSTPAPADSPAPSASDLPSSSAPSDLLDLKQQALQELTPLVSHLEQSPEEKFRTTMMMLQATDNQALLKDAYEAANAISDEKSRAQALLDVVNEINYFTQHKDQQPPIN